MLSGSAPIPEHAAEWQSETDTEIEQFSVARSWSDYMIRALYAAGSVTPAQDSRPERWLARRETNVDLQIRAAGKTGSVCALSYSVSPRFIMKGECKLQTGTHSPQKSAADSSAWTYSITTKDIQDVALSLLDRELTNDEFLTATKYFENGIQWWDVAENAVDLALEDHRMITS